MTPSLRFKAHWQNPEKPMLQGNFAKEPFRPSRSNEQIESQCELDRKIE